MKLAFPDTDIALCPMKALLVEQTLKCAGIPTAQDISFPLGIFQDKRCFLIYEFGSS